jgi:hypothetical protein
MADKLKAGGLGSVADPAIPNAFANSMARAMEIALNNLLASEGRPAVPEDNSTETRGRRLMFLAIAQGVVNHLVDNDAAFRVKDSSNNPTNFQIEIVKE